MDFSMKGGGLEFYIRILKNDFFKTIWNHSLTVKTCFAPFLALCYVYIVVEVTMNMAK